jgi:hypothetical protein
MWRREPTSNGKGNRPARILGAALALGIFAAALTASAGTKMAFSWRNPAYTGASFKNIMVLAVNGKAARRADFEDQMTAVLTRPGLQVVQSYSLIPRPEATPIDPVQLREVIQGQGFDAVLVSRITQFKKTQTYVPGDAFPMDPYYGTFYGYYAAVMPIVYTPGYMQTDTKAQIETNLYSTATQDGQLVWTGTSTVVDPRSPTNAIKDIVKEVVGALQKENVI